MNRKSLPCFPLCAQGFTLMEMLLALLISSLLFLGAGRFFPWLLGNSRQLQQQMLLAQELRQVMLTLEKYLRRAGYCEQPPCGQPPVTISSDGQCLVVRLQSRRYVTGGISGALNNDSYAFRLNKSRIETRRGIASCGGEGWESLTDPRNIQITRLHFSRQEKRLAVQLEASGQGQQWRKESHWLRGENL